MKFKQLLLKCKPEKAIDAALSIDIKHHEGEGAEFDAQKQREGYKKVFEELLNTEPKNTRKWKILVEEVEDWFDKSKYVKVHSVKANDKSTWGMDGMSWADILGMDVISKYSKDKTVGYIIWEITFYGWASKDVKSEFDKILKDGIKDV